MAGCASDFAERPAVRQAVEQAAREATEAQEKIDAQLRRLGFNLADQRRFGEEVAKLSATQRLRVYRNPVQVGT
jgi:hypothetical protein